MILAAGLGTRLRPYSELRPKPLFPVVGQPLLTRTIAALRAASFSPVVVNAHHLGGQIAAVLASARDIILQEEEAILGTGGGLRKALPYFGPEPVLVTNGDIFHTIDFEQVYRAHLASGATVTMVLHDEPRFNKVVVTANNAVAGFGDGDDPLLRRLAFTGIHVIDPAVLSLMPADTFYDIIDCYRSLLKQGAVINALVVSGHFWTDMGTPEDYLALHGVLLGGRVKGLPPPASPFHVGPGTVLGERLQMKEWAAIGAGARIGDDVSLERVVVWDGAIVPSGSQLIDTIVT